MSKHARNILKNTPWYVRLKVILWGYYKVLMYNIKKKLS